MFRPLYLEFNFSDIVLLILYMPPLNESSAPSYLEKNPPLPGLYVDYASNILFLSYPYEFCSKLNLRSPYKVPDNIPGG